MKISKNQLLGLIQESVKVNGGNQKIKNQILESVKRKLNEESLPNNKMSKFERLRNGEAALAGSFDVGLMKLFYLADNENKRKLINAFPEFFGEDTESKWI